jgi:hypothetical protein
MDCESEKLLQLVHYGCGEFSADATQYDCMVPSRCSLLVYCPIRTVLFTAGVKAKGRELVDQAMSEQVAAMEGELAQLQTQKQLYTDQVLHSLLHTHRAQCMPIVLSACPSCSVHTHRDECMPIVMSAYPS